MGKILIVTIILYALFVFLYFLITRIKRKKNAINQASHTQKTGRKTVGIVGKSNFVLNASKPPATNLAPLGASLPESENQQVNPDIFVPDDNKKSSAKVLPEELDKLFGTAPYKEKIEMNIDYPLEYEKADNWAEEETEELEGTSQAALASGVSFEELGNMLQTVNEKEKASPKQKQEAGDTLLEIRCTDMFEQLVSGRVDRRERVKELIAESLDVFHRRKDAEIATEENKKAVPDDFNIRDFV